MKNAADAIPAPITHGSTQPRGGPWVKRSTAEVQPRVASSAPEMSSLRRSWWVSESRVAAMAMIAMPIGTFTRNANRHETTVTAPPATKPNTEPRPCIAADHASA